MSMKYYSTQRSVTMGSYPNNGNVEAINNFDEKTYCESIGREAYGYIEYAESLTESEAKAYELTKEGMKTYYCVMTSFDDKGHTMARITSTKETDEMPESSFKSTRNKDIYTDWFEDYEEAVQFVEDTLKENGKPKEEKSRYEYEY